MKNLLMNSVKFLAGVFVASACGLIATKTVYFGVAVACWLAFALGAWYMFDSIKSVIIKK